MTELLFIRYTSFYRYNLFNPLSLNQTQTMFYTFTILCLTAVWLTLLPSCKFQEKINIIFDHFPGYYITKIYYTARPY